MSFKEVLASFAEMVGEDRPEDMLEKLSEAFDGDMSAADAKVGELNVAIDGLTTEVARLKAHNYDLMKAGSAAIADGDNLEPEPEPDPDETDYSVESAFEEKE